MLRPAELFNPLTAPPEEALTGPEVAAGPFGLLLFLPLVPLLRYGARLNARASLIITALIWLFVTLGPRALLLFILGTGAAAGWVVLLAALRRSGRIGPRAMIGLLWAGLHLLALPVWFFPSADWCAWEPPSRIPIFHSIGFAYFLLRFIAWGTHVAHHPDEPRRLRDTLCWVLYPPCMRLGPVVYRRDFLARYDAWDPRKRTDWRETAARLGLFVLGGIVLAVVLHNMPKVRLGAPNFFEDPGRYTTRQLLAVVYLVPMQIYLLLWMYNELAAGLGAWVGIRVDNNFRWLPLATSVRDFWRRWHVTVGRWLREHMYIPLGGNRGRVWLHYLAVFAYIGVWHGPSWSFLAWGVAQGLALMAQRQWDHLRQRSAWLRHLRGPLWTAVCWLLTMHFALVTIVMFADFDHLGMRLFAELVRRMLAAFEGAP